MISGFSLHLFEYFFFLTFAFRVVILCRYNSYSHEKEL